MPEIIGTNPNRETECGDCGTRFRFLRSEVRAGQALPNSRDDHHSVVTCPHCRMPVDVSSKVGYTSAEKAAEEARVREDYDY